MIVTRVERHCIKKTNKYYSLIDDFCFKSKNLYNHANYIIRQEYIQNKKWVRYGELDRSLKNDVEFPDYREMPTAQSAQQILRLIDKNWKSYYALLKENLVKQNSISHFGLEISPCHLTHNKEVFCQITSQESQTNYHFLTWDKVVRKYWSKTSWNFVCDFIYFLKAYIFSGIVKTFTQKSRTQLLAGFYPIVYFIGGYVLCFVVAYGLFVWIKEWNSYVAIAMILACLWIGTKGRKVIVTCN